MNTPERLEVAGALPKAYTKDTKDPEVPVIALPSPPGAAAQRFRLAAIRLEAALDARRPRLDARALGRLVIVTSPEPRDGKTTTALYLATALARGLGRRVALVEVDRSRPGLGAMIGMPAARGLADVVAGKVSLDDVLLRGEDNGPLVIPGGEPNGWVPPSSELLAPMNALREYHDYVIADVAALDLSADAAVLGRASDGVLLVVRAGATRGPALSGALEALVNTPLVGCVLNDLDGRPGEHALGPQLRQAPRRIVDDEDE